MSRRLRSAIAPAVTSANASAIRPNVGSVGTAAVIVSESVAELFPGVGSVTPAGAPTVAVLVSVPAAAADTVQLAVYVTEAPVGNVTLLLMLPEPLAVNPEAPPLPAAVNVHVSTAGNVSTTGAPVTPLGPALDATIVYNKEPPAAAVVTPSVFVMLRSAVAGCAPAILIIVEDIRTTRRS
jgi:hypothetical protein